MAAEGKAVYYPGKLKEMLEKGDREQPRQVALDLSPAEMERLKEAADEAGYRYECAANVFAYIHRELSDAPDVAGLVAVCELCGIALHHLAETEGSALMDLAGKIGDAMKATEDAQ